MAQRRLSLLRNHELHHTWHEEWYLVRRRCRVSQISSRRTPGPVHDFRCCALSNLKNIYEELIRFQIRIRSLLYSSQIPCCCSTTKQFSITEKTNQDGITLWRCRIGDYLWSWSIGWVQKCGQKFPITPKCPSGVSLLGCGIVVGKLRRSNLRPNWSPQITPIEVDLIS